MTYKDIGWILPGNIRKGQPHRSWREMIEVVNVKLRENLNKRDWKLGTKTQQQL